MYTDTIAMLIILFPPGVSVINVWTTDPVKKLANRKSSQTNSPVVAVGHSSASKMLLFFTSSMLP